MERTNRPWFLWPFVHSLESEARRTRGVPDDVIVVAKRAVELRFGHLAPEPLDTASRQRVAAYFWGTVRRRALRHAPTYSQRVVRVTLEADLAEAGWDPFRIRTELERLGLSA